jgi:deoxycytidylate deaminase
VCSAVAAAKNWPDCGHNDQKVKMKNKMIPAYMDVAYRFAQMSSARRLQVGAIIVKDDRIISIGYNGMPTGWDNECEDREYMSVDAPAWIDDVEEQWPFEETYEHDEIKYPDARVEDRKVICGEPQRTGRKITATRRYRLTSKPEVLHAEQNALMKLARSTESGEGATLFVTHAPCLQCAKNTYMAESVE